MDSKYKPGNVKVTRNKLQEIEKALREELTALTENHDGSLESTQSPICWWLLTAPQTVK